MTCRLKQNFVISRSLSESMKLVLDKLTMQLDGLGGGGGGLE